MEKQNPEKPVDIWDKLSQDGQSLTIYLGVGGELTQGREYLEAMADDPEEGFNLDLGMQELTDFGILQQVSLIQEKREKLASMPKPPEVMLMPITEIPRGRLSERFSRNLTNEERDFLRLRSEIADYEKDHEKHPEIYKKWDEPRYRLRADFQDFTEKKLDENKS